MTTTVNTRPLASLLTDGTQGQSRAASSPVLSPDSNAGGNLANDEGKFFNILQIVKNESLSKNSLTTPTGQAPWAHRNQPSGLFSTAEGVHKPLSYGQAQLEAEGGLSDQLLTSSSERKIISESLTQEHIAPGSMLAIDGKPDLEQGLAVNSLQPVDLQKLERSFSEPGGRYVPPGGKDLPASYMADSLSHRSIAREAGRISGVEVTIATRDGTATLPLKPETASLVLTPAQFDRMPVPEFAAPLAKSIANQEGSAVRSASTFAQIDPSPELLDRERVQTDLTRMPIPVSSVERLSGTHQVAPTITLPRPAGAPGWDQGLGQRIVWMVENGLNQAELRLDPPNLGSVSIRISMHEDQAQLQFQAANQAAREALESALPKLREMFNQQGLELGDADVSDNKPQSDGDAPETGHSDSNARLEPDVEQRSASGMLDEAGRGAIFDDNGNRVLVDEFV